jgi:serine/threonine protein kinase
MASDEFYRVAIQLQAAVGYRDVFPEKDSVKMKTVYRMLARIVHPDRVDIDRRDMAAELFAKLESFYREAQGTHTRLGTSQSSTATGLSTTTRQFSVTTQETKWCDIATCYRATASSVNGAKQESFVKLARQRVDNDLMAAEANALELLWSGDPKRAMFFPKLIETFGVRTPAQQVRANALEWLDGFVNLERVRAAYPGGIDPLDMAWMWRRILWALDYAHGKHLVHGAVFPQNILIHPSQHGVILADWCYSSLKRGAIYLPLKAIVAVRRDWYPSEVLAKQPATPSLDIVLAARSMVYLMNGNPVTGALTTAAPVEMRTYFANAVQFNSSMTKDAATAAIQFDELLVRLGKPFHPRVFRPFSL